MTSFQSAGMIGAAVLWLAGCSSSAPTPVAPQQATPATSKPVEVTLYLPGMNAELQIL